jgi:hypothetical protein
MGDLAGARDKLRQALALAAELGAVPPLLWALPVAALHYASRDRIELARELYALALRYPFVAESCWFTDVTGKPLAACGVAVADGQIPALKDGGGTCLLQATVAQLIEEL